MIDPLMFIALLPAVVLVVYICRKDRTDKEPPALIAKLLGFGVLSCLPAIVVELILSAIIERLNVRNVYLGYFLEAFVVAGLTEETCKFLFLRTTWRSPAFDYQFDAIVYAVMVALGFAAFENVKYVYSYGIRHRPRARGHGRARPRDLRRVHGLFLRLRQALRLLGARRGPEGLPRAERRRAGADARLL